jgi:Spy/CpxP family protein refolding chaperone
MTHQPSRIGKRFALPLAATLLLLFSLSGRAHAQHGGGPPGGGGGGQQPGGQQPGGGQPGGQNQSGGPGNSMPPNGNPNSSPPPNSPGSPVSTLRGGLQLGPPGRWWDDDHFAKSLGLNKDQQHRMDAVFKENKAPLLKFYKTLQHEESQLEKLSRAKVLDEAQIDLQIDHVVQARGDLEKANAHLLIEIRKQMTPDQTSRLDEHRPSPSSSDN